MDGDFFGLMQMIMANDKTLSYLFNILELIESMLQIRPFDLWGIFYNII